MSQPRLLLFTDLDRTLLPNGFEPESPDARECLSRFVVNNDVTLVYVTGRHLALVEDSIRSYHTPTPHYIVSDVGTKIYQSSNNGWQAMHDWEEDIGRKWNGYSQEKLQALLTDITALQAQEASKQNTHKMSYYVALNTDVPVLLNTVKSRLKDYNIDAALIWSIDDLENIGLLDIIPANASKLHAIEFLQTTLGFGLHETIFSGDSGNDISVMESPFQSVLVANASDEIKHEASNKAQAQDNTATLYIAHGDYLGMNGNYSAGILEGVHHFFPEFRAPLKTAITK